MLSRGRQAIVRQRLALSVLAAGLALTALLSGALASDVADGRRAELDGLARQARTAIERRVASYAEPLYGMSAVLGGPQPAGRADFRRYVELAGTARRQPGLLAYTFNRFVPAAGMAGFEEEVRTDTSLVATGYPDFRVYPDPGTETDHVVVDFVEPPTGNERIFGFDLASDPVRMVAIAAARDSGRLVATAPVALVQDDGRPGFLMYVPVYRTARIPDTAPARRRHFAGVVTAAVSLDQMLADVLGGSPAERPRIAVRISDVGATLDSHGRSGAVGTVLFDSGNRGDPVVSPAGSRSVDLNVGGRRWRLAAAPKAGFGPRRETLLPWGTGARGAALSVLLAGLVVSLSGSRQRAVTLAAGMTISLRRQEEELRRANVHLAESNAALARADQAKDDFLGTMSHELRTPLTAIVGFARLLELRWERLDPGERQESLARIGRSAATLGGLVDDLLEFNRTGDHAPALSPEPVDLARVVTEVIEELSPLTATHRVELDLEPVNALADRAAVARILTNLVTNAVKFSPDATTVTVTTRAGDGVAVLEVADQGPGIPAAQRSLVFERFFRGEMDGPAKRPGTGIGLAVVKDLADRLGGSVRIVDTRWGALFRVELPLAGEPPGRGPTSVLSEAVA